MSKASDILDNVSKVIVGKRNVSELVLTSIIAGGHFKNSVYTRSASFRYYRRACV